MANSHDIEGGRFVNVGIFTVPQAARLLGIAARRVRYWIKGDAIRAPAVPPRLPDLDGVAAISFADLMELRFVVAFLDWGIRWERLRDVVAHVRSDRSLSDKPYAGGRGIRFTTDGVTVFVEQLAADGDKRMRDLATDQHILAPIIEQSLKRELDIDDEGFIRAWWPERAAFSHIVVDPTRSFGRSIVTPQGVPTETLSDLVRAEEGRGRSAEQAVERIAQVYDVDADAVRQAVAFEHWRPQRERMAA